MHIIARSSIALIVRTFGNEDHAVTPVIIIRVIVIANSKFNLLRKNNNDFSLRPKISILSDSIGNY